MDKLKQQEDWGLLGLKEFAARERSVTLTEDEWAALSAYISDTTEYRAKNAKRWRKLAAKKYKKHSGSAPIVYYADDKAKSWENMSRTLDRIRRIIDAPYLTPEESDFL